VPSAKSSPSPRLSAAERREQLLDATRAVVSERGFHAVSIEAVSREAGVTRPIVYGHFGDLSGLLEALVDREEARARAQLIEVLPGPLVDSDPDETLLAALDAYLRAVLAEPDTWRLVLMPQEGAPQLLHDRIARGRAAVISQLVASITPGMGQAGESPDPELTALTFSALSDEAARLLLTQPRRFPVERIVDHARWLLKRLAG
jgi:AcrR family transcriptional regulator